MTEADQVFRQFAPFIREYIYSHGWESLRPIQLEAAKVIFGTQKDLLLCSSTASGKTEAAFFPILSEIVRGEAPRSVAVLYIAPLKSLINDQFFRMEELLDLSGVRVTHWHGDVGKAHKEKLLKDPQGILQITPESLESMLMNRPNDIARLFCDLRFVVLDEIHAWIGTDRGNQVLCQLARLGRHIGRHPRRVGLSATLGERDAAARWLCAGSGHSCVCPDPGRAPLRWRLGMAHFYIQDANEDQRADPKIGMRSGTRGGVARLDPGYEYLYDAVAGRKALVFSNSREQTEYVTATLRQIAEKRAEEDIFLIHHGNLSAALREEAENKMKDETVTRAVTCATVTMELGIDIGRLERVAQMGAPTTVCGFLQRLGRSGRRGAPPEMVMVYREDTPLPNTPLPQLIPWEMLRGIAIVDVYATERFIEPPRVRKMPLSLAFHQTLSILASEGEMSAKILAGKVLSLPPMEHLDKDVYRELLLSMVRADYLQLTETGGLLVGLAGERLTNSFKFYAVFKDSEDYTVRAQSEEIGTISAPPPVGDRFALAGRVWEVCEVDMARKLIFVKAVDGKMEISWPGDSGEIHTRLLEVMREILFNGKKYAFLSENAAQRLENARHIAKVARMDERMLIPIGGQSYVLFPWLGTRSFRTLRRFLQLHAAQFGISDIQSEGCCYITMKVRDEAAPHLWNSILDVMQQQGMDPRALVRAGECPVFDKYDEYIPPSLLREAYAADRLDVPEVLHRFLSGEEKRTV